MALVQSTHLLSFNGESVNSGDQVFPGTLPTAASPCPIFGLPARSIQGISAATAAQIVTFPPALTSVNIEWFVKNQRFTGTILVSETTANVIAAT